MGRSLVRTSSTVYAGCTCDFNNQSECENDFSDKHVALIPSQILRCSLFYWNLTHESCDLNRMNLILILTLLQYHQCVLHQWFPPRIRQSFMELVSMISFFYMLPKYFKGCILVFEYTYFLLQQNGDNRNDLNLAVKEYERSGTQAAILNALQHVIQQHGDDHDALASAITEIILTNCMCKLILFKTTSCV